jgi:hypothetical protein
MQVLRFIVLSAYLGDGGRCFVYAVLVKRTYLEYLIKACWVAPYGLSLLWYNMSPT